MYSSNKRKLAIFVLLVSCIGVSIAANKPTVPPGEHKNLQILPKDISDDSLDMIMDEYKEALGVKCSFCHAQDAKDPSHLDFASDDKQEKGFARYMMTLTTEINGKYFNFENSTRPDTLRVITCMTCHHGQPRPGEMEIPGQH